MSGSANDNLALADFGPALALARQTVRRAEAAVAATRRAAETTPSADASRRLSSAQAALSFASEALGHLERAQVTAQTLLCAR